MSEPHELEERAAKAIALAAGDPHGNLLGLWTAHARAVLALVRVEQEKDATNEMADRGESSLICGPDPADLKDSPSMSWAHARSCYRAMIRAWWLSHTAKETSNA